MRRHLKQLRAAIFRHSIEPRPNPLFDPVWYAATYADHGARWYSGAPEPVSPGKATVS